MVNSTVSDRGNGDESVNGAEAESASSIDASEGVPSGGNASIFHEVGLNSFEGRALATSENKKYDEHRHGDDQLFKVST